MPRDAATTRTAVLVGAAVLLGGALLARPGTAADDAVVEATRASLEATAPAPSDAAVPDAPLPGGTTVVRPDGVDGLRLGMSTAEVVAGGWSVGTEAVAGCRRVVPGSGRPAGRGRACRAGWWTSGSPRSPSTTGPAAPPPTWARASAARWTTSPPATSSGSTSEVVVPWQEAPVVVEVARTTPGPGTQVAFADLTADGRVDHVQVRTDAAAGCAAAEQEAREAELAALPVLDLQGRGELRGRDAADRGAHAGAGGRRGRLGQRLRRATGRRRAAWPCPTASRGCSTSSSPTTGPGEPEVRGITVDAGRTDAGLAVGDPALEVASAYPGLTAAYLEERWGQGLSADWQLPGGVLRLWPGREQVPVVDVDAVLRGPRDVVGLVQVGPGC